MKLLGNLNLNRKKFNKWETFAVFTKMVAICKSQILYKNHAQ